MFVSNVFLEWLLGIIVKMIGVKLMFMQMLNLIDVRIMVLNLSMKTITASDVQILITTETTTLAAATQEMNVKLWDSSLMIYQWSVCLHVLRTNTMTSLRPMNASFVTLSLRTVIDVISAMKWLMIITVGQTQTSLLYSLFVMYVFKTTLLLSLEISVLFVKKMNIYILKLDARNAQIMLSIWEDVTLILSSTLFSAITILSQELITMAILSVNAIKYHT